MFKLSTDSELQQRHYIHVHSNLNNKKGAINNCTAERMYKCIQTSHSRNNLQNGHSHECQIFGRHFIHSFIEICLCESRMGVELYQDSIMKMYQIFMVNIAHFNRPLPRVLSGVQ